MLAFSNQPASAVGLFGAGAGSQIKVSAEILPAADKKSAVLRVTCDVSDGWKLYSISQKPGGPKRTQLNLIESDDYKLLGSFRTLTKPKITQYPDFWPGLNVEEHKGKVVWEAPVEIKGVGTVIRGELKGQACSDSNCVDVKGPIEAQLTVGQRSTTQTVRPPSSVAPPSVVPPSQPAIAFAPQDGVPKYQTEVTSIVGSLDRSQVAPGDKVTLTLSLTPAIGWHIYALADQLPAQATAPRPTLVAFDQLAGLNVVGKHAVQEPSSKPNSITGGIDHYHSKPVDITVELEVPQGTQPGDHTLTGVIGYQACTTDVSLCNFGAATFAVTLPVGASSTAGILPLSFNSAKYKLAANLVKLAKPTEVASSTANDSAKSSKKAASTTATTDWTKLRSVLVLAFLGGLILNIMPCVLPVIGIKIMSFVQQAGEKRGRIFALNMWYALGMIAVFMVLAALAAFANLKWAEQFERPEVGIGLAALVFAFALSLLGVWEIPIPGFVVSGKATGMAEREGAAGAFSKGILTTLLATPCTGPFMGTALAWAVKQPSHVTFATFASIGLGMASPYLVIGAFPQLIQLLPKPGAWMDTFKNIMGFVLLATVAWIFTFVKEEYAAATLGMMFAIWAGCWWIGRTPYTANFSARTSAKVVGAVVALGLSLASFYYLVPGEQWEPYTATRLTSYRNDGTTVLIDFTAKSCFVCQVNKGAALYTEATREYMQKNGVKGLTADLSDDAPHIDKLMEDLGRGGGGISVLRHLPRRRTPTDHLRRQAVARISLAETSRGQTKPRRQGLDKDRRARSSCAINRVPRAACRSGTEYLTYTT